MQSDLDGLIRRGDMPSSIAVVVPKQVLGAVHVGSQEDNLSECHRLQREAGLPYAVLPVLEQHNACRLAIGVSGYKGHLTRRQPVLVLLCSWCCLTS